MNRVAMCIGLFSIMLVCEGPARGQVVEQPQRLDVTQWLAGVAKKSELPATRVIEYSFAEIQASDIDTWLGWVGVRIPVDLSGSFSGWLWAQRSDRGWLNFSGYRLEGEITSPKLRIEQWEFREAQLRFGYADDRWYVGRLAGEVAAVGADEAIGKADFVATLPQNSPRLLQVSGEVEQTQIGALLKSLGVDFEIANDTATFTAAANVPLERVNEPTAWQAAATVDVQGVRSHAIPRSGLSAKLAINAGEWRMTDATVTIIDQLIGMQGRGKIDQRLPFTASFDGRQLQLSQLLRAGKQSSLAKRLSGAIDAVGTVRGDVERGIKSASAAVRARSILIDNENLEDVLIESVLDNRMAGAESLEITIQSAAFAGGKLGGEVRWNSLQSLKGLIPDVANLQISAVDLVQLPQALRPISLFGVAEGQIEFAATQVETGNPITWSSKGSLTVSDFSVMGSNIGHTVLSFSKPLDSDRLQVQLKAAEETVQTEMEIVLEARAGLSGILKSYSATGKLQNFRTQLLLESLGESVSLTASGKFSVQGKPTNWLDNGNAELSQLVVQLDKQPIELNDLLLNIRDDVFRLERFTIRDERGRVAGSALVRRDGIGQHLLNLRVAEVEIEPYVTRYGPPEFHGLEGVIGLEARLQKAAASSGFASDWSGTVVGAIENVEYRSTPLGEVTVRGAVESERIVGSARGSVLGGELRLSGEVTMADFQNVQYSATEAFTAALNGIQLNRLMALVYGPRVGNRYSGTADIEIESGVRKSEEGLHIHLGIPNFSYERQEIASELFADLQLGDGMLLVRELNGGLASGRVEIAGDVQFAEGQTSGGLQFSFNRVELNGIAALLFPDSADNYEGVATYRGRAQLGGKIEFVGTAQFADVLVYQLPIQNLRSDLAVSFSSQGDLLSVDARNAHGTALGGRFDGSANLRGGVRFKLDAQGQIGDGKLDQLSRALGFEHIVGTGSFNASTRLTSVDAMSIAALSGPLLLEFENGDAQSVPLLADIGRLIPILQLASTEITSGTLHGQLGQGQLRIDDLLLNSEAFWLVAKGSASLISQRLDFEALIQTGGGIDDRLLQEGSQKLLAIALPQLAVVTELNNLVSNRTLYFNIGGTTKHPIIQPKAAQTAAKALLQNVARQLLIVPAATTAPVTLD